MILFVYRDEVYHENSEFKGVAEIIVGKGRDIETGTVRAAFLGQYNRFETLSASWQPPAKTQANPSGLCRPATHARKSHDITRPSPVQGQSGSRQAR